MSDHQPDPHPAADAGHAAHDPQVVEALGPIDWGAWAMAVLGSALALVVAVTLVMAARP